MPGVVASGLLHATVTAAPVYTDAARSSGVLTAVDGDARGWATPWPVVLVLVLIAGAAVAVARRRRAASVPELGAEAHLAV
ncbi:hypothetical protein [Xylanimonas sp. McL0601]|uniref:hypothetical protein n=1 Tax=Xylanimonas sp. McL0601 TaxID=3414739 RepID=UPI003CF661DE